jgi:hypothetical protein
MLPAMFWFIWPSGFRGGDLKKIGKSEKHCNKENSKLSNCFYFTVFKERYCVIEHSCLRYFENKKVSKTRGVCKHYKVKPV